MHNTFSSFILLWVVNDAFSSFIFSKVLGFKNTYVSIKDH